MAAPSPGAPAPIRGDLYRVQNIRGIRSCGENVRDGPGLLPPPRGAAAPCHCGIQGFRTPEGAFVHGVQERLRQGGIGALKELFAVPPIVFEPLKKMAIRMVEDVELSSSHFLSLPRLRGRMRGHFPFKLFPCRGQPTWQMRYQSFRRPASLYSSPFVRALSIRPSKILLLSFMER